MSAAKAKVVAAAARRAQAGCRKLTGNGIAVASSEGWV